MKDVKFVGSSHDDLRAFPKNLRQDMGRQIEIAKSRFKEVQIASKHQRR